MCKMVMQYQKKPSLIRDTWSESWCSFVVATFALQELWSFQIWTEIYVNRMNSLYLMFFINFGIDELLANFAVGFIGFPYLSSLVLNKIGQLASFFDQTYLKLYWTKFHSNLVLFKFYHLINRQKCPDRNYMLRLTISFQFESIELSNNSKSIIVLSFNHSILYQYKFRITEQ